MGEFSARWLALREPHDHRARDRSLLARLGAWAAERPGPVTVLDLGAGSGSGLRGSADALPPTQRWRLVDRDPDLLAAQTHAFIAWADVCAGHADTLAMLRGRQRLTVTRAIANLDTDLEVLLAAGEAVVASSALIDLVPARWLDRLIAAAGRGGVWPALYMALCYTGTVVWRPSHPVDMAATDALNAHQRGDKGLGWALGPDAAPYLAQSAAEGGWRVWTGASDWVFTDTDRDIQTVLLDDWHGAITETGRLPADTLAAWRAFRQARIEDGSSHLTVGHADLLALPQV